MAISAAVIMKARFLLLLNFVGHVFLVAAAALFVNDAINSSRHEIPDVGYELVYYTTWTAASGFSFFFATIAGVVGVAAALPGLHHVRAWSQGSLPAAAYPGFMAWLLTLLALGLVIKDIIMGARVHLYKLGSTEIVLLGGKWYLIHAIPRALFLGCLSAGQLCYLRTIFHTRA